MQRALASPAALKTSRLCAGCHVRGTGRITRHSSIANPGKLAGYEHGKVPERVGTVALSSDMAAMSSFRLRRTPLLKRREKLERQTHRRSRRRCASVTRTCSWPGAAKKTERGTRRVENGRLPRDWTCKLTLRKSMAPINPFTTSSNRARTSEPRRPTSVVGEASPASTAAQQRKMRSESSPTPAKRQWLSHYPRNQNGKVRRAGRQTPSAGQTPRSKSRRSGVGAYPAEYRCG
jgi:hypothetical protein